MHAEECENTRGAESEGNALSGEHEIEIDADELKPSASKSNGAARSSELSSAVVNAAVARASARPADEEAFELSDDEIEPAEASDRPSLLPGGARHRPPPPPSMRPRPAGASSTPPPARALGTLWSSTQSAANARGRIATLEQEVADARWQLANRTLELTRARARSAELEHQLTLRERQIAALERALREAERAPRSGVMVDVSDTASLEPTPTPQTVSVVMSHPERREFPLALATVPSPTVSSVARAAAPPRVASETPLPGDVDELFTPTPPAGEVTEATPLPGDTWAEGSEELARISGINPLIAQSLRDHGVTRLSQVAAWSDDDIRRIAKAIKVPKSRISRGRWVQKAREALKTVGAARAAALRDEEAPASTSNV
jgi:predicted flap endonuclease-1-like 5' DNA nuclease